MAKTIPNIVARTWEDSAQGKANFWDARQALRNAGAPHTSDVVTLSIVEVVK